MKAAAFNQMIAEAYTTPLKTVTVYARLLKEAGLMTTGARGRNAPEMTPLDAARLTIAMLTTDSPSQGVERVKRFGQLPFSPDFKTIRHGYEVMGVDKFHSLFKGETLEEVLAYQFGLPAEIGILESVDWFQANTFHLRILDFEVRAELFRWNMQDDFIVGETVIPFKGQKWVQTESGVKPIPSFTPITGGIRTERSIIGGKFLQIGMCLMHSDQDSEGDE